jgi:type I restriction enzyme S subunit
MRELLTKVCRIQYGYAFDSSLFSDNQGLPLVRIRDVVRGFSETYTMEKCGAEYLVRNGDMLIGMDGEFNIAKWNGGDALLNQRVCRLIPSDRIDAGYLYYFMPSALKAIEAKTPFVTVKHLSAKELNKVEVPLLPINEQRSIAKMLDSVSSIIAARKHQLAELDNLVKAQFVELFGDMFTNTKGWTQILLSDAAEIVSGITKGRKTASTTLFSVPYMAVSNVKDGYIDWTTVKTIMATAAEIDQYRLFPNDVLMTEGGDPDKLGRGAIIQKPLENCIHQNHIFRVRLNQDKVIPAFFDEYLKHQKAKRYFLGCAKQTTGIASINMSQLRALPLLCPPLDNQKEFAAFVEQVDKSKVVVQKALDVAQLLFDSMMQKYFD